MLRYRGNSPDVVNDIIALGAIATGESLGECAILIPERDAQSIVFQFAHYLHIRWQFPEPIFYFFL